MEGNPCFVPLWKREDRSEWKRSLRDIWVRSCLGREAHHGPVSIDVPDPGILDEFMRRVGFVYPEFIREISSLHDGQEKKKG